MMSSDPARTPMPIAAFDFDLPPELIAQTPIEPRDAARLLVMERDRGVTRDAVFSELPNILAPGDLLVLNDTRVLPARLLARRASGGRIELLLLARQTDGVWSALARPARRVRDGEQLRLFCADGDVSDDAVTIVGRTR